jgi:predicted esterase
MRSAFQNHFVAALLAILLGGSTAAAGDDDDIKDVRSQDLRAGKDDQKRYFLIGPDQGAKAPAEGYGLVVVLPGGDGSAEFHPFVKRIYKKALPKNYLVAQPVAVRWKDDVDITWPTARDKIEGKKFDIEEFVKAVLDDVEAKHKLNPERIFTLSWSSGGPAAYAISMAEKRITGSFVAMSVFNRHWHAQLEKAKGHAYYIYHSPDDAVCRIWMARWAERELEKAGAKVKLKTYEGEHGWGANAFDDIREGVTWLEKNQAKSEKK